MPKEIIDVSPISEALAKAKVPLSPAVKANGFVFVSGLPPFDRNTGAMVQGGIKAQTEASLENVKAALEAAGSSLDKVVKVKIYIANAAWFANVNDVYASRWSAPRWHEGDRYPPTSRCAQADTSSLLLIPGSTSPSIMKLGLT